MTQGDPHNLQKRLQKTVKSLDSEEISTENQELLKKFYNYLVSQELSNSRVTRHLIIQRNFKDLSKPLVNINRFDWYG